MEDFEKIIDSIIYRLVNEFEVHRGKNTTAFDSMNVIQRIKDAQDVFDKEFNDAANKNVDLLNIDKEWLHKFYINKSNYLQKMCYNKET